MASGDSTCTNAHRDGIFAVPANPRKERITIGDHDGIQIKVWLPESMYSTVRELAAAHTDGNMSQAVRVLLQRGLEKDALEEAAQAVVDRVTSQLDHLERLAYFAAVESASATEHLVGLTTSVAQQESTDPAVAKKRLDAAMERIRSRATERLTKALHTNSPGKDDPSD